MGSLWPDEVFIVPVRLLYLKANTFNRFELFRRQVDDEATDGERVKSDQG